ncbi:MAG: hypothetical protein L0Y32_04720 [Nevskiales bacterium]|nr:hypothetical protein [Nevskiales bacterium]
MNAPLPEVLIALGVPDDLAGTAAAPEGESLALRGNTGLSAALIETLRARKWPVRIVLLRPGTTLKPDKAGLLINAVCEPILHRRSLRQLAQWQLHTGLPVLNPWWVIAHSGRQAVARRLAWQDGVRIPHCTVFRRGNVPLVEHIARHGHRYPVLLRPLGAHGSHGLVRVDDGAAAAQQEADFAAGHVTDFVEFKSPDGLYRKYRFVFVNDTPFRRHVLMDREWNLTGQARHYMREHLECVAEEKIWMSQPVKPETDPVARRVLHQFRALQLDFGSVDFGLLSDGTVLIFEINACVQLTGSIPPNLPFDWSYLEANNGAILDALLDQIRRRAARPQPAAPIPGNLRV